MTAAASHPRSPACKEALPPSLPRGGQGCSAAALQRRLQAHTAIKMSACWAAAMPVRRSAISTCTNQGRMGGRGATEVRQSS